MKKKKNEYQKFQDFKKRHNLTETQIIHIISEYAKTNDEFSCSFFCAKHNITSHVFYKMRDFTIIFMLVDDSICRKIKEKSLRNQGSHNSAGNHTSSAYHYKILISKRHEYLKSFSEAEIVAIANEYANFVLVSEIATKHNISAYTVQNLLMIALINRLIPYGLFKKIQARSDERIKNLTVFSGHTALELWNYHRSHLSKTSSL